MVYALISWSNSGTCGGSMANSKQDVHQWLSQSEDIAVSHPLVCLSDIPCDSHPEMLQRTDNLRGTLNQKLTRLEVLLRKGESEKLVKEMESL